MKIILFFVFSCIVMATKYDADYYNDQIALFCQKLNKHACSDELLVTGMTYFLKQVKELNIKTDEKRKKIENEKKRRRVEAIKEERFRKQLREHFFS